MRAYEASDPGTLSRIIVITPFIFSEWDESEKS